MIIYIEYVVGKKYQLHEILATHDILKKETVMYYLFDRFYIVTVKWANWLVTFDYFGFSHKDKLK